MNTSALIVCLCLTLLAASNAQILDSLFGNRDNRTDFAPLPFQSNETDFLQAISERTERERRIYSRQYERFLSNKTLGNILVKLKDTEDVGEDDDDFLDPFFEWVARKKRSKFEKFRNLMQRGMQKMEEKMKQWDLFSDAVQQFYGVETGVSILSIDSAADFIATWMTILADPDVEFAEVDMELSLFGSCDFLSDWGYHHTRADIAAELLGLAPDGRDADARVLVAVVDSGVDVEHPLLRDRIWINEAELNGVEGVDDDGNGYVDDVYGWNFASNTADVRDTDGHGTHVAGIIAGEASVDPEFSGAAPNVVILPCRFTEDSDSGLVSTAVQCLEYAFEMGVDMVSNSWGGAGVLSFSLEAALNRASQHGKLQISAAGNSAVNNDGDPHEATYPASYDTDIIISVAAVDSDGRLSDVSNYGSTSTDIGAPGAAIYSTYIAGETVRMSGTSQATPYVTAAAALLLGACRQQQRTCTALDVKEALLQGAVHSDDLDGRVLSRGFLDIPNAAVRLGIVNSTSERDFYSECSDNAAASHFRTIPLISSILVSLYFVLL